MKRIALPLKKYFHYLTYLCVLCCLFLASNQLNAQVGINNIDPKASLDITVTDPTDPQNTEGLLVPRVSVFPTIDPGVDQNGMLLYLTATVGLNTPGFYYWNQTSTSWLKVTDSSVNSSDADFYEEGTTTAPNAITDNIFHTGDISIGGDTSGAKLTVQDASNNNDSAIEINRQSTTTNTFALKINSENNAGGGGIYNDVRGTVNSTLNQYGLYNDLRNVSGTGRVGYGIYNNLNTNAQIFISGVYNQISGTGTLNKIGFSNYWVNSANGSLYGLENTFNATSNNEKYAVYNTYSSGTNGTSYGIRNNFFSTSIATKYGMYNNFTRHNPSAPVANGTMYGVYNVFDGAITGTYSKYGVYNNIPSSTAGVNYGIYSTVLANNSYAGYFLGRVSVGTTIGNNYILPSSRGTNNQIMQTDGSGNVSWVDASSLGDHDFYEIGSTSAANSITDDIYTQGRMAVGRTTISNTNAVIQASKTGQSYFQITSEDNGVTGLNLERLGVAQDFSLLSTSSLGTDILSFTRANAAFNGFNHDFYLDENGEFTIAAVSAELDNKVGIGVSMVGFSEANKVTIKGYGNTSSTSALKVKNSADTDLLNIKDNGLMTIGTATTGYTFPSSRGTNNQILQTNGSGTLIWTNVPNQDLEDADGDTKIQVEESADEDKIRFDLAGTEYVVMEENQYGHFRMDVKDSKNNIFLGDESGLNNGQGASNTTHASWNIGIGGYSLYNNTIGYQNIAIGRSVLLSNVTGFNNIALGHHAFSNGGNGNNNVAIGISSSQRNVGGNSNVTIGSASDINNTGGSNNVIIGYQAGRNTASHSKSGSVMIGNSAGYQETTSNKLYIDNTSADGNNALIYGEFGTDNSTLGNVLRVNGKLQIGTSITGRFELPSVDGAANQIMQTDGSGVVSWVDPSISKWTRTGTELDVATAGDDIHFNSDQSSITFAQSIGTPSSMIYMFDGGTTNVDRMVLSHSSAHPGFGLQYKDSSDSFVFKSSIAELVEIDLNSGFPLRVYGTARAEDFESDTTTYPDYVFENYFEGSSKINPSYNFNSLLEVENFIKDNGHLPGVKSFSEVKKDGMKINLAETSVKNLEKIEELFLYTIEISKENKQLKSENELLQEKQNSLEERLQKLENIINNNN
ncbi:MAG: hypothetical protein KUG68_03280 [Flavobacteriaceae bacterium]|nr:hypothetical protein [Flavobacteriaceae bacterium]